MCTSGAALPWASVYSLISLKAQPTGMLIFSKLFEMPGKADRVFLSWGNSSALFLLSTLLGKSTLRPVSVHPRIVKKTLVLSTVSLMNTKIWNCKQCKLLLFFGAPILINFFSIGNWRIRLVLRLVLAMSLPSVCGFKSFWGTPRLDICTFANMTQL